MDLGEVTGNGYYSAMVDVMVRTSQASLVTAARQRGGLFGNPRRKNRDATAGRVPHTARLLLVPAAPIAQLHSHDLDARIQRCLEHCDYS